MLVFIPMSGFGDRYKRAGYTEPKPLIPVAGVPMIERIVGDFPADTRFLFGVNRTHAETTDLVPTLKRLRPTARIEIIEPHKDGPIQTVLSCADAIPDDEDVLLNYCDFGVDWSFPKFKAWLDAGDFAGAMTAYRGFHPHSLGPTLYAYMRSEGDRALEIREKHHFTPDKFSEYASSGLYWFKRGADLKRIAQAMVASGERVNGEFYVSMAMQALIEEKKPVGVYPLDHFYQWGTPEDLRDYEGWSQALGRIDRFLADVARAPSRASHVIPMAGRGQRFVDQGYADPKPLIPVAGRPMIAQAIACLPAPRARVLVAQTAHTESPRFREAAARLTPAPILVGLDHVTEGQACTARLGVVGDGDAPRIDLDAPLLIAPCDTGYVYDVDAWLAEESGDADLVVMSARGHLPAIWRPQMYGWMRVEGARVTGVAVKKPVADVPIGEQHVVTGTFLFRSARLFLRECDALVAANDRVNGEFYVDTIVRRMVEAGAKVRAFAVDKYIPWGTPEELKTFDYWNDVFRAGRNLPADSNGERHSP